MKKYPCNCETESCTYGYPLIFTVANKNGDNWKFPKKGKVFTVWVDQEMIEDQSNPWGIVVRNLPKSTQDKQSNTPLSQ